MVCSESGRSLRTRAAPNHPDKANQGSTELGGRHCSSEPLGSAPQRLRQAGAPCRQSAELDERFLVNLSNPQEATLADPQGAGAITDDDAAALSIDDVAVLEGNRDGSHDRDPRQRRLCGP